MTSYKDIIKRHHIKKTYKNNYDTTFKPTIFFINGS